MAKTLYHTKKKYFWQINRYWILTSYNWYQQGILYCMVYIMLKCESNQITNFIYDLANKVVIDMKSKWMSLNKKTHKISWQNGDNNLTFPAIYCWWCIMAALYVSVRTRSCIIQEENYGINVVRRIISSRML